MHLAIFDFDGTISTRDSFTDFIFFCFGIPKTLWGIFILSPHLILYVLGLEPNWKTKGLILDYFFKGMLSNELQNISREFAASKLPDLIRPGAAKRLQWHKDKGHRVVVVSASFECYLTIWCRENGIDIIATKMETEEGFLTGKLATKNCHGEEKIVRIKEKYDLSDYDHIYAYGDTKGDLPLKTIAHEFFYKPFRN